MDRGRHILATLAAVALAGSVGACGSTPGPTSEAVTIGPSAAESPLPATPSPTFATEPPTPTPTPPTIAPTPTPAPGAVLSIPVLYYHKAIPIPDDFETWTLDKQKALLPYMVTPCELSAQLDWLVAHGYHTILPRDLAAYWDAGVALPSWPVILTFDDGTPDWHATVFPMLTARGMTAEFYVTVNRVGPYLTWADLAEMVRAGMGVGGHDMDHIQLVGGVPTRTVDVLRYQVTRAKAVLEQNLGITVDSMAYVGGGYNDTLMGIVHAAGYTTARSINRGVLQPIDRRFRLRVSRIGVFDDVPDNSLADARACVLDPAMADFEARVTGTDPG